MEISLAKGPPDFWSFYGDFLEFEKEKMKDILYITILLDTGRTLGTPCDAFARRVITSQFD